MKKLVILGLAIVLLVGGAGAYFFILAPEAESAVTPSDKHEDVGKEKPHGGAHTAYMELTPLLLPVIDEDGVQQTITINIAFQIGSVEAMGIIKPYEPLLKDAFIRDVYGILNEYAALHDGELQVGMVQKRLFRISNEILGEGTIDDVLLKILNQQDI